jgi:hypothetical protein
MRPYVFLGAPLLIFFLICSASFAQELSLPGDYAADLQLGLTSRARIMNGSSEITGTPANQVGDEVFHRLISGLSQPYPWKLTLVNNGVVNAGSTAGGQVYVHGGLVPMLGQNKGLWAAVLSHETAHTARRHQLAVVLRQIYDQRMIAYYRARIAAGDKSSNWALIGFSAAAPLALKKMERDQEHDADQQGMLLMARAGYHPDYVFALHHLLAMDGGERSHVGTFFFSDHPRWETRDQRSDRVYADALAEFNRSWPDASSSPGGTPPVVAFMGEPNSKENKNDGFADVSVPLYCRNTQEAVDLILVFQKDGQPVHSAEASFADDKGNLVAHEKVTCPEKDEAGPTLVRVPATVVDDHDRSTVAAAYVANNGQVIAGSKTFEIHFPKVKKR